MDLGKVAEEIQHRIIHIFGRDREGRRATNGGNPKLDRDPHFRDYVLFHEVRYISVWCGEASSVLMTIFSTLMVMMGEGSEPLIRPDGELMSW
jgi:hypothetical protein